MDDDFRAGIDLLVLSGESDGGTLSNGRGDEESNGEEGLHFEGDIEFAGKMIRWYKMFYCMESYCRKCDDSGVFMCSESG